ncbi:hypothetical protein DCAR_0727570 [Daucus carota subsp. sativus]|uniref:Uncharacterized protein n=1 Tax=Daucus carota subsp. sativus TaxID=79200 RepID=A0A164T0Y5_DAUCS|nr:PREDICTED: uncharacterized protein LOC108196607 [Daucus carota subsp. sativus]WOH08133.1 hypothetical protein DCAR_0727570 [Daucus carota subsp. sativus]
MDYSLDPQFTSIPNSHPLDDVRFRDHVQQKNGNKDDELVKHMTNLPAFLQPMDTRQSFQGKLLHFGVLDWQRLEKWNNHQDIVQSSSSATTPSCMPAQSSTLSTAPSHTKNYASQRNKYPSSDGLRPNSAYQDKQAVWSRGKVTKPRGFETAPWSNVDGKQNFHMKAKSSGEMFSDFDHERGRRKESDKCNKSAKELLSLNRRKNTLSTSSHVTKSAQDALVGTMMDEKIDIPRQPCDHDSIVLLLPKSSPSRRGTKSIQLPKSRTSFDSIPGETDLNLGCLSPEEELHYLQLYSEVPHSCPLPQNVATRVESNVEQCSSVNSLDVKLQFDASGLHQRPKEEPFIPLYSKCRELHSSRLESSYQAPRRLNQGISAKQVTPGKHVGDSSYARKARNATLKKDLSITRSESSYYTVNSGPLESGTCASWDAFNRDNTSATSKISSTPDPPSRINQDTLEQAATMVMHTSPSRRFTFSRMTRSLSYKEGTSLPPLSSSSAKVKSGPLSVEAFRGLDKFDPNSVTAGYDPNLSPSTKTETSRTLDHDLPEQPGMTGRHSSPSRFSFSRMTRSFSFKEGSSVPRLSSCGTESGPVRSEAPSGPNDLSQDNLRVSNSARFGPSATTETPKRLAQNIAKQPDTAGRHTSPSRRFSFSNRRKISKSLDFKEVSSGPQLSFKSHPAALDAVIGLDRFNQDSISTSNRTRSSPLRRLLDPLLKPRGVLSSAETVKPLKQDLTSVNLKPLSTSELLQNHRHETSNVQALLQLTRKNGLPLFKLVVDNGSDVLVAAVKQLPTPGDNASCLIYALYSVHEIKNKNGSWMSQGFRGKRSSFGYNIIGQMKVFNSCPPGYGGENLKDQYVSRESVLYGVEMQHGNKETPELRPSKELAAIAIKNLNQVINDREQGHNGKLCSHEGFTDQFVEHTRDGRETNDSDSTTVILGGVHGLPEKVLPSPSLICRYGGSCDCGGWDVGCKLQILTTQDQKRNSGPSSSCSTGLDLFSEGGHQENKPSFSLSPFKTGVYSVEFNSSISLLQSFFMSIAFISSQKLHEIFEGMLDARSFTQPNIDKLEFPIAIPGDIPAKYVTKPPPSPVGRV